jgi:hypothetical protein
MCLTAAELLEADQIRMVLAQREEQVRTGFEAVVGTVVDHGRQVLGGRQDRAEVGLLRNCRRATRQHARDHHQASGANFGSMASMGYGALGVDRAGADDDSQACLDQSRDPLLALRIA